MQNIESIISNLSKSNFRSKFHLKPKDIEYIKELTKFENMHMNL